MRTNPIQRKGWVIEKFFDKSDWKIDKELGEEKEVEKDYKVVNIRRNSKTKIEWKQGNLSISRIEVETWMTWWSLWCTRQREQRAPFIQSKQYILHSLLWASVCNLQWTKKLSSNRGFNHGGHLLSSSSGPPAPYQNKIKIQSLKQSH